MGVEKNDLERRTKDGGKLEEASIPGAVNQREMKAKNLRTANWGAEK